MDEHKKIEGANDEIDLFQLAAKKTTVGTHPQENTQVDLFEYATHISEKSPSQHNQDKSNYTIDDSAIPEIDLSKSDLQQMEETGGKAKAKFRLGKKGIAAIASVTALSVLFISAISVFLNFYGKMDYVADDTNVYYYNINSDGIKSSPFVKNILLIGTDERTAQFSDSARADCMMILSINSKTGTISLVSLERGMTVQYLKSENSYSSDLLTHVFRHGGAGLLVNTIQNTFKVGIDGYIRVNFNTFAQIIDTLGGVDIELTSNEVRGLNTEKHKGQVVKRKLSVGVNHLSGEEALLYARLRWIDSDFKRVERQRKVVLAVREKLKNASYLKLMNVASNILPLIQTNISSNDMASIILRGSLTMKNDMEQMTVPISGTYSSLGNVDFEQNSALLQQMLYE